MTEKSERIVTVTREEAARIAREWATPENLAWLDSLTLAPAGLPFPESRP